MLLQAAPILAVSEKRVHGPDATLSVMVTPAADEQADRESTVVFYVFRRPPRRWSHTLSSPTVPWIPRYAREARSLAWSSRGWSGHSRPSTRTMNPLGKALPTKMQTDAVLAAAPPKKRERTVSSRTAKEPSDDDTYISATLREIFLSERCSAGRAQAGEREANRLSVGMKAAVTASQQALIPEEHEAPFLAKDEDHPDEDKKAPSEGPAIPSPWRNARKWRSLSGVGTSASGSLSASHSEGCPRMHRQAHAARIITSRRQCEAGCGPLTRCGRRW